MSKHYAGRSGDPAGPAYPADPDVADNAGQVASQPVRPPAQAILDTFGRARPLSIANAARVPGSTVRVTGRAVAGPGGVLRAPLSGVECVWYRSVVFRHLRGTWLNPSRQLHPFNPLALSDSPTYAGLGAPGTKRRLADDHSSTAPFVLDDGTGMIAVDPSMSDVDSNIFGINEVVVVEDPSRDSNVLGFGGGPFDHQEVHTEWVIPVGAQLLAVGTVRTSGGPPTLVATEQDVVLVSTKPEQQVLSRNRTVVDPSAVHLPFRSARSVYLVVGAALTVVLVIALVVLLVVLH